MWKEVIAIYPALLDCVTCNSADVRQALKEALKEFAALLAAPQRDQRKEGKAEWMIDNSVENDYNNGRDIELN